MPLDPIAAEAPVSTPPNDKRAIHVIVICGSILVGLGLYSFIAVNWLNLAKVFRTLIIIASILTAYFSGWHFKERAGLAKLGSGLIFLGILIYGAGIFLIAHMYGIQGHRPEGYILWMIGSVIMAFASKSRLIFSLAIIVSILAMSEYYIKVAMPGIVKLPLVSLFLLTVATIATFLTAKKLRNNSAEPLQNI